MIKKTCIGVCCIMICFSLAACKGDGMLLDRVTVMIKEEFWQKFDSKEFDVADFKWENVKEIEYWSLHGDYMRVMTVYLNKHGKNRVLDAVEHFGTLDFVLNADPVSVQYSQA